MEIASAQGRLKAAAIFKDVFASIPFHKAEVEDLFGFERADAARAGAETVD